MGAIREYAEWNNNWWEKAGDFNIKRVMLIGDSITSGYRDYVQQILKADDIMADKLCGSRCAGDAILTAEIELALGPLNGYKYEAIHFNNGLHGGCNDTLVGIDAYIHGITEICEVIKRTQPVAKIIIATSTHMTKAGAPADIVDEEYNSFVIIRNRFLREFAAENGYALDDLYSETAGNLEYRQPDGVHFDAQGFERLGHVVAGAVKTTIGL
jgi:hypothetical protein